MISFPSFSALVGRHGRLAGHLFLPLVLAGCASFAGIGSQGRLQPAAGFDTALSLPDQGGAWPDAQWASTFGGAPLQALIDEALAGNPGLQVAASRVAAAQAAAKVTALAEAPVWNLNATATRQRYTENGIIPPPLAGETVTDGSLTLNFRYDFDFWGRNGAALRSALSQGKVAQAEQYNARLVLSTAVARGWLQLARNSTQLDLVRQQLQTRESLDRLTRQRVAAGLDSQSETQASLQQAATLRAEIAQWQEAIALNRNQLAALLGAGPDRGLTIARPVLPAQAGAPLPPALPLMLVGRRPDIVAARWRVEAAQGQIDYAKTQFYPNVDIMAFAGFSSLGLSNLIQSSSRTIGVGPAIRLPIFNSNTLRAQLQGQVSGFEGAVATYNQTLTDALRDVADQVQSLRAATVQADNQQQATQAATRSLALATDRRRVGTINQLQLLAAEGVLLTQRRIEFDAQARRLDLRIALIKALGGGFEARDLRLEIRESDAPANGTGTAPGATSGTGTGTGADGSVTRTVTTTTVTTTVTTTPAAPAGTTLSTKSAS